MSAHARHWDESWLRQQVEAGLSSREIAAQTTVCREEIQRLVRRMDGVEWRYER